VTEKENAVLEVKGLYKRFAKTIPARRRQLARQFRRAVVGKPDDGDLAGGDEFWALDDVSFTLDRGEALGLIGVNGAGKSTLLSIIARQLLPDRGVVRTRGRIAGMINLTAGFEDSLTGKENIYLKGALLGRTRRELRESFDDIVGFAEIGEFLEAPVGTYSSGMRMRLAFSVAIHAAPDLLLIDEVLSVGDFGFRQRCLARLNELRSEASFVFVSHSFQDVIRFCSRLIVLDKARLVFEGDTREGVNFYVERFHRSDARSKKTDGSLSEAALPIAPLSVMGEMTHRKDLIEMVRFEWETDNRKTATRVRQGEPVTAAITFRVKTYCEGIAVGLPIWNSDGLLVTSVNSDISGDVVTPGKDGLVGITVTFESIDLNPGVHFPILSIGRNCEILYRQLAEPFEVTAKYPMTWGVYTPRVTWGKNSSPQSG